MRDVSKQVRIGVFTLLNGNTGGVPVYDEKVPVTVTSNLFILLSTQQQTPTDDNDCTWISKCSIDIEVYQKSGSEVSKDTIDDTANVILGLLITAPGVSPITAVNLQFGYAYAESILSRNVSLSETQSILTKIIRFVCTVTQQL